MLENIGFLQRNPSITIHQPESTSMNRVTPFNKEMCSLKNFGNPEDEISVSSKIYNMDKTGISTGQDPGTIIAENEQKRLGSVTKY